MIRDCSDIMSYFFGCYINKYIQLYCTLVLYCEATRMAWYCMWVPKDVMSTISWIFLFIWIICTEFDSFVAACDVHIPCTNYRCLMPKIAPVNEHFDHAPPPPPPSSDDIISEAIKKNTSPNQIDYYLTPKLIPTKYICLFLLKTRLPGAVPQSLFLIIIVFGYIIFLSCLPFSKIWGRLPFSKNDLGRLLFTFNYFWLHIFFEVVFCFQKFEVVFL